MNNNEQFIVHNNALSEYQYQIVLDASTRDSDFANSYITTTNNNHINTDSNATIGSDSYWANFAIDDYFKNVDIINSITSFKINYVGSSLSLNYGTHPYNLCDTQILTSGNKYDFNSYKPTYFSLVNSGSSSSNIISIEITYTCDPNVSNTALKIYGGSAFPIVAVNREFKGNSNKSISIDFDILDASITDENGYFFHYLADLTRKIGSFYNSSNNGNGITFGMPGGASQIMLGASGYNTFMTNNSWGYWISINGGTSTHCVQGAGANGWSWANFTQLSVKNYTPLHARFVYELENKNTCLYVYDYNVLTTAIVVTGVLTINDALSYYPQLGLISSKPSDYIVIDNLSFTDQTTSETYASTDFSDARDICYEYNEQEEKFDADICINAARDMSRISFVHI